jgi:hypothetical protein
MSDECLLPLSDRFETHLRKRKGKVNSKPRKLYSFDPFCETYPYKFGRTSKYMSLEMGKQKFMPESFKSEDREAVHTLRDIRIPLKVKNRSW